MYHQHRNQEKADQVSSTMPPRTSSNVASSDKPQSHGNKTNGQGVWNNQKRTFENMGNSSMQPNQKEQQWSGEPRRAEPGRQSSYNNQHGYGSSRQGTNSSHHYQQRTNYQRNERHEYGSGIGHQSNKFQQYHHGRNFESRDEVNNYRGRTEGRSHQFYDSAGAGSSDRRYVERDNVHHDFGDEKRGRQYGHDQQQERTYPRYDAPKSGFHSGDVPYHGRSAGYERPDNPQRSEFSRHRSSWYGDHSMQEGGGSYRGTTQNERYGGGFQYRQRDEHSSRIEILKRGDQNQESRGFSRYNQARSPTRHRSRSKSSSPPRTKPVFEQQATVHHNQNQNQEHREGYRSQSHQMNSGHSEGREPRTQTRTTNGQTQQYYYIEDDNIWVSKSDYNNPNNPNYMGRSSKNRQSNYGSQKQCDTSLARSGQSSQQRQMQASEPRSRSRSPGDLQYQQLKHHDNRAESPPRVRQLSRDDRDHVQSQQLHQQEFTQRMKVAGSSPSRPPLDIVRRVPLIAKSASQSENPGASIDQMQASPKNMISQIADIAEKGKSQDRDSEISFTSPKSQEGEKSDLQIHQSQVHQLSRNQSAQANRSLATIQKQQVQQNQSTPREVGTSQQSHCSSKSAKMTRGQGDYSGQSKLHQREGLLQKAEAGSHSKDNAADINNLYQDDDDDVDVIPAFEGFTEEEVKNQQAKMKSQSQPQDHPIMQPDDPRQDIPDADNSANKQMLIPSTEEKHGANEEPSDTWQRQYSESAAIEKSAHDDIKMVQDHKHREFGGSSTKDLHYEGHHESQSKRSSGIIDQHGNKIDSKDNCNIYVAGIPRKTTEDQLKKHFSKFGTILNVHIIKDHNTKVSRGFAYILYKSGQEANHAISKTDQTKPFNDWNITVEHAKRGELVTKETIEKYSQRQQQRPYVSSSVGYDYSSGQNYSNTRQRVPYQSYERDSYDGPRRTEYSASGGRDYHYGSNNHAHSGFDNSGYGSRGDYPNHHHGHNQGFSSSDGYYASRNNHDSHHQRDFYYRRGEESHNIGGRVGAPHHYNERSGFRIPADQHGREGSGGRQYDDRDRYGGSSGHHHHNQGQSQGQMRGSAGGGYHQQHRDRSYYDDKGAGGRYANVGYNSENRGGRFERRDNFGGMPHHHGYSHHHSGYQGSYGTGGRSQQQPYNNRSGNHSNSYQQRRSPIVRTNSQGVTGAIGNSGGQFSHVQPQPQHQNQRRIRHSRSRSRSQSPSRPTLQNQPSDKQ